MNPNWLPAIVTVIGLIGNTVWVIYNLGQKNAIKNQQSAIESLQASISQEIGALREEVSREYVSEKLCAERMRFVPGPRLSNQS